MEDITRKDLKGIRSYSPGKPISEVKRELRLAEVVKLASNESPYPPFPETLAAIERELRMINRYPDGGCFLLKKKLAEFLNVPENNLAIGHGSNELQRLILASVLESGDEVVMATPSFIVYPTLTKVLGGISREIPLRNYKHDLGAMRRAITSKTKAVFICNPNNPTGTIVNRAEVREFLEKIPDNILVVFDEAYSEYVEAEDYPNGLDYFRQGKLVAVLRTFSKIYSLAGLRIGYGIMPEFLVNAVGKVREPFNVNSIAQAAALVSLDCQKEVEKRRKLNIQGKKYLCSEFERLGLKYVPTEANFIFVNVDRNSGDIFKELLEEGVIVRTGDIFGQGYENFIRVTIGMQQENQKLIRALEKILS